MVTQNSNGSASPATAPSLVTASGISKSYPRAQALFPLSFSFAPGERVALVGPSGSGKTTLLRLLAGLIQPDSGEVRTAGRSLAQLGPGRELARLVGIIHQQYDLVPHLSTLHNVMAGRLGEWSLFRSLLSLVWPQERHLAETALAQMGIPEKLRERASRLSGGEQQRVAIARLIVQSPQVILADEPIASLDPARADDMLRLLTSLSDTSDKTLIVSIHSPALIQKYFTRVIALRNGQLQFDLLAHQLTEDTLNSLYELAERAPAEVEPATIP